MKKGRHISFRVRLHPHSAVLALSKAILISPAFFFASCDESVSEMISRETVHTKISLESEVPSVRSLDIFFYNDDRLQRLDSYQHIDSPGQTFDGASRDGKKILVALANFPQREWGWDEVGTLDDILSITADLRSEEPGYPVMSAILPLKAGYDRSCTLPLRPVGSLVVIHTLSCDFHGTAYPDEMISNLRAYLINVNSVCPALSPEACSSLSLLNTGRLSESDLSQMAHPSLLSATMDEDLTRKIYHPGTGFLCYPNPTEEESIGTPMTRLVVEGTIAGRTYYYPVNIAPPDGGTLSSGQRYVYNITLSRRGLTSPDAPADALTADVRLGVEPWTKKEPVSIAY